MKVVIQAEGNPLSVARAVVNAACMVTECALEPSGSLLSQPLADVDGDILGSLSIEWNPTEEAA